MHCSLTRRKFVGLAATSAALCTMGKMQSVAGGYWKIKERKVKLQNLWTGERLEQIYWYDGDYLPDALSLVNYSLRDHRSGESGKIFRGVLDQLFWLGNKMQYDGYFGIVSGFRSESTNRLLRGHSENVAQNSLHMYGMAIDIRMEQFSEQKVWEVARSLRMGGAGLYYKSKFVHLDVGPIRSWAK